MGKWHDSRKSPVLATLKVGPQAQALSQPAVVRSDLSGVISESFEGILFFLEALWPGRNDKLSFLTGEQGKTKPLREKRVSDTWDFF